MTTREILHDFTDDVFKIGDELEKLKLINEEIESKLGKDGDIAERLDDVYWGLMNAYDRMLDKLGDALIGTLEDFFDGRTSNVH